MEENRLTGVWAAALLLVLLLLSLYFAGYFLRCEVWDSDDRLFIRNRIYPTDWETTIFRPAARVESLLSGKQVSTGPSLQYVVERAK